jgi:hypothetical protein
MSAPAAAATAPDRPICVECGNDASTEGYLICFDCLLEFYADVDPPDELVET